CSKRLVALVAFLSKFSRSSGSFVRLSSGIMCSRRLPTTCETRGIPYLSRRICPIRLGEFPSFDSFRTSASTSSGSYLNQAGGRLLIGLVDTEIPRLPEKRHAKMLVHYLYRGPRLVVDNVDMNGPVI